MNIWHDLSPDRVSPSCFVSVIEISKGYKNKYEMDKETGMLMLDRVLYTSTHYPTNYGFIPRTFADDNDPLDVLVLCQEPIAPLTLVKCYPVGVFKMVDEELVDEKILAIPCGDPAYNTYVDIGDLPTHIFDEISHFFRVYKELEGKKSYVREILGCGEAKEVIRRAIKQYNEKFGG